MILVTGANGMLGSELCKWLPTSVPLTHKDLDITNKRLVVKAIEEYQPDTIINCAGIIKSRRFPDYEFIRVNGFGPQILKSVCTARSVRLIQISTDCVFSGRRGNYSELDLPDPIDVYGRSKLAGEVYEPHLTIRTSFIGKQKGLLAWLLAQKGPVQGYMNALWNGLTLTELCRRIRMLTYEQSVSGVIHLYGETISKYDLLKLCVEKFSLNVEVQPSEIPKVNRSLTSVWNLGFDVPKMSKMIDELV